MSDFRVYGKALTGAQIESIVNGDFSSWFLLLKYKKLTNAQQIAERNKLDAQITLDEMSKVFLNHMRNPLFFSDEFKEGMRSFKDRLDTLKLPENAGRPWFDELLKGDECICGNPMDEDAKKNIKQKQEEVLEGGFQVTLNTFKTNFDKLNVKSLEKDDFIKKYDEQIKKTKKANIQLRKAKENFKQAQTRGKQELMEEIENLKKERSEKRGEIKRYSVPAEPGEFQDKLLLNTFNDIESEESKKPSLESVPDNVDLDE